MTSIYYFESPVGWLELTASEKGLEKLEFVEPADGRDFLAENSQAVPAIIKQAIVELEEYFSGQRQVFSVKLAPQGTPFQTRVWQELAQIPFGQTVSYKDVAAGINNPKAVRAVGGANGKNPIPIIVPCHRVVAANGGLGGYTSGLTRKKWLLRHEGIKDW